MPETWKSDVALLGSLEEQNRVLFCPPDVELHTAA